jgi:hypothetical protein
MAPGRLDLFEPNREEPDDRYLEPHAA